MLQRLGRFEIIKPLGQGAMGEVYLGRDPGIGREVALKTIHREAAQGAEARERFAREARAAGTLNHPNLVTIHEFGEDQGVLYLAMEFVPGVDLEALLRDRVLAPVEVLEVLAQVCDGLAFAHEKGVLHRDIKPGNIRVKREGDQFRVKVMDFGIARIAGSDMTGTGTLLGTFSYMAPEYIKTGVPDPRCDLFAVGVMLYEALSGHRPFEGEATATVLYRLVNEEPTPLATADIRGISPQVVSLLAKAMAKDPSRRFQDAASLARALRAAQDPDWVGLPGAQATRPSKRPPVAPAPRSEPRPGRQAGLWAAGLLVLVGAGAWAGWRFLHPAPRLITLPPSELTAPQPLVQDQETPPVGQRPSPKQGFPRREEALRAAALSERETKGLLDQAAAGIVDQPQSALSSCERVLRDQPANARAYALKTVALYGLGRYEGIPSVVREGRLHGVEPRQYLPCAAFREMVREERRAPRLPPEVRAALLADLPGMGRR